MMNSDLRYLHDTATGTLTAERPVGAGKGPALRTAAADAASNAPLPLELAIEALEIAPVRPMTSAMTTRDPAPCEQRLPTAALTARATSAR